MSSRKCENWLLTFREWVEDTIDAPLSYVLSGAFFTMSAVLERKVHFPRSYLGRWTCYPNMYMILVGPYGMRKTTVLRDCSAKLLREVQGLTQGSSAAHPAAILEDMKDAQTSSGRASIFIVTEEFATTVSKSTNSGLDTYDFYTDIYDGKVDLKARTIARGNLHLESPNLVYGAGTTPEWIAERMPVIAVEGGFASRVFWIYGDELRNSRLLYLDEDGNPIQDDPKYDRMERDLLTDLRQMYKLEGQIIPTKECASMIEEWYQKIHMEDFKEANRKLQPYIVRRPEKVLKLAMFYSLAEDDELIIEPRHFEAALGTIKDIEASMSPVFARIGKHKFTGLNVEIIKFVGRSGEVEAKQLLKAFQGDAEPMKLNEIVMGLLNSGQLIKVPGHNKEGDPIIKLRVGK